MFIQSLKNIARKGLRLLGYQLKTLPRCHLFHIHDFADQKGILLQRDVKVVFDLGANVGVTVRKYRRLFPDAVIYCFEPHKESYQRLLASVIGDRAVRSFPVAVSAQVGPQKFYVNELPDTNSLLAANDAGKTRSCLRPIGCVEVPTTTLEHFCSEHSIDNIQVLKMDIQGGELRALQGASRLLERQAIDLIYTEIAFAKIYEGQPLFFDVAEFLERFGYVLYGLYNVSTPHQIYNAPLEGGDAIFISPEVRASLCQAANFRDGELALDVEMCA